VIAVRPDGPDSLGPGGGVGLVCFVLSVFSKS
jgi:hypothetical protein